MIIEKRMHRIGSASAEVHGDTCVRSTAFLVSTVWCVLYGTRLSDELFAPELRPIIIFVVFRIGLSGSALSRRFLSLLQHPCFFFGVEFCRAPLQLGLCLGVVNACIPQAAAAPTPRLCGIRLCRLDAPRICRYRFGWRR
ncbi:hypothetical protein [Brevibacterium marinum]|uniref:Uncharacterized protein n=1 Tax=Brevibacterium marinum TaxID=418643 RepID=A0A846S5R3_9MICO|nr:hypothetical protein [Brevibacterium marinum]NJC56167.1 hypothetical protein [Brevibacterium marinum]